ncbi:MAG: hypothetical protein JO365_03910, partial [Bradyrhizobium sp.]|nr:hypothetical protein [Bradyrhizobium sp.]
LDGEILDIGQPIEKAEAMLPIHSEDAEPAQVEMASNGAAVADADTNAEIAAAASDAETEVPRPSLAQKVRAWLGRAA